MKTLPPIDEGDIRKLARTLRRIDGSFLRAPPKGTEHIWYQGEEPYFEVFLERDADGLKWFQLTVRTRAATWSRDKGRVETGMTTERELDEPQHPASKIIKPHERADKEVLHIARRILEARADVTDFDDAVDLLREAEAAG